MPDQSCFVFMCHFSGRPCHSARAVQALGISGDPPGNNCNHQEASRNEQKPPGSLWDLLATIQNNPEEGRSCACNYAFLGSYGLFGWVHLGMVHRCLTTDSCRGADTVRARCNNTLFMCTSLHRLCAACLHVKIPAIMCFLSNDIFLT